MKGNLLEAYCALAKAECFLNFTVKECGEREELTVIRPIEGLREKIIEIQREIIHIGEEKR